ncbi:MAG: D-sedoheptulose 7-phosphate isomerase [Bdellovibrionales bacterium]|jgi:D-sedoheptulose 7-phosphate isomerase|nr:D-sedoheptulose 7-phosphate isomerase [Bdellovibrionales bacterium]
MAQTQTNIHGNTWLTALKEAQETLAAFASDPKQLEKCSEFSQLLISTFRKGGRLFTCGNGGSHCDAMHFAEEFTGRYRKDRKPLGALALGDPSHVTCVSNDYGFEHIFSRQLLGLAREGDVLVGLSTSGNSGNVIRAFEAAQSIGVKTVGLLGRDGGKLAQMADLAIVIPATTSDRIQEMHIKLIHTVIETVERDIFPENYA